MAAPSRIAPNPYWPLPADYGSLDGEGQRLARVNACKQWLLPYRSPRELGEVYAKTVRFFDSYYLHPDFESDFNPFFYPSPPRFEAPFHELMLRTWGEAMWVPPRIEDYEPNSNASVIVIPRGGAKTYEMRKTIMLRLLSRPGFRYSYNTNSHDNTRETGGAVRRQLYENQRILDDWAPEYGGRLKPPRGERSTGEERFYLSNESMLRCQSVEGRLRGGRFHALGIDDAENDERASTSLADRRANMERLLFSIALPMVSQAGNVVEWAGTFVSPRHYLWFAMETIGDPPRAKDSRFDLWTRLLIRAAYADANGVTQSCWPDMWPATEAEIASTKRLLGCLSLEKMEARMGRAAFEREMMGRFTSSESSFFGTLDDRHHYHFEHTDEAFLVTPTQSQATIHWLRDDQPISMEIRAFLAQCRLFMTVDTSYTARPDSDFKCACVMALTPENELFILDLWAKQCPQGELLKAVFQLAERWRVPTVHPEVVRGSHALFTELQQMARGRIGITSAIVPAIIKLSPGIEDKNSKIGTLKPRFEHGLIKFPRGKGTQRPWTLLFDQIAGFNPDGRDGGLSNDDCFPAATRVLTRRGWIAISTVTVADEVLTRFGWRQVLRAWITGTKKVITRFGIQATPSHPIWTENRGWVPLESLRHNDMIMSCTNPEEKPSSFKAGTTTATQTLRDAISASISGRIQTPAKPHDLFIETFGNRPTAQFQKDSISTISTATPSITPSTTFEGYLGENTSKSIEKKRGKEAKASGNSRFSSDFETVGHKPSSCASLAAASTEHSTAGAIVTVLRNATPDADSGSSKIETNFETLRECGGRPTPKPPVQRSSDIESESVETWNLTVEEHPEFFAEGILVHNCLDCVSMSMFVIRGRPQRPILIDGPSQDPLELLASGQRLYKDGTPIAYGLSAREIPADLAGRLSQLKQPREGQSLA